MIAVRDGKLTLTATDMEIAIVEDVARQHHPQRRLHRARRDAV
jgi:DNA polymerase III sliding clamp (beta) subunit (PCNA family)